MARPDQSRDWATRLSPSLDEVESLARDAFAHLPDKFRALCADLIIQIEDFPDDQVMDDMGLESPFELLGLFEGTGIGERFSMETGDQANRISLYRRPILDYWAENDEALGDIINHVLIHEIGHHFGLSDDDMDKIEEAAE
ncbi:metallopeptidase family protein [Bartonella sp. LJL80]